MNTNVFIKLNFPWLVNIINLKIQLHLINNKKYKISFEHHKN